MDERILVEVYLPIVGYSIDVYLPPQRTLADCAQVWMAYAKEHSISYEISELLLYDASNDKLLNPSLFVKDSGLTQGAMLICM